MKNWKDISVTPSASIRDTVAVIDAGSLQLALVVDVNSRLVGTVSDGDVRRALLRGIDLADPVPTIMNTHPTVATLDEDRESILTTMRSKQIQRIPILDADGCVVGLETFGDLVTPAARDNIVVLMAGGMGTRLRPLTEDCPKPMLKIGNRPILETIVLNFIEFGFRRFFVSVNYRAEMITNYFGDGSSWGVEISYLNETQKLGTAGSLSLLPQKPAAPFIVMNGDLLTKVNFNHLLDFHAEHESIATMCVREYVFQVPYGVIHLDRYHIRAIEEKPTQRFFVNAGIYAFEPSVLHHVPYNHYLDMPTLFDRLVAAGGAPAAFPLREYWLDVGRHSDLETANGEFEGNFT